MKTISLFLAAALTAAAAQGAETDTRWGDLGDGTFANPVLNADYSDPDMIRVGDKYYLTCSEFHFMGMVILESDDMVNWKIVGKVFDSIDIKVEGTTVAVDSTSTASVRFFTPDGRMALSGVTPGSFSLPSGLYLLSVCSPLASKTVKLALR